MKFNPKAVPFSSKALFTIVGGAVLVNPVFAQEQSGEELQEVVVTGLRSSLIQAMEIKRDAIGVVDAITAEDIGKFPDTNLAESLQRIPGVSIDRQNGEGSQVTVRGFGPAYNLVTLNGRTVPTAEVNLYGSQSNFSGGQGRSFDFSNIAAEAVSALEVYKTGQALLPSGGIGATINVKTRRPLDKPGLQASFGVKGLYDTSAEEGDSITPEVSGVLSWTDDAEKLGFGLFGEYSKRDSSAAMGQANDWIIRDNDARADGTIVKSAVPSSNYVNMPTGGQLYAMPQDSRYDASDLTSERINGQAVFQFRPMEALTLTADYTYFQNKQTENRYEQTNWFATPYDHVTFDGTGPVWESVYMQEVDDGTKDMGFEQTNRAQKDEFKSAGFNAEWALTDTGTLKLDVHKDKAESSPDNPLGHSATFVSIAAPVIAQHSVSWDNSDHFPVQSYTFNDSVKGNNNGVLDVGDLATQVSRSSSQWQKMDVDEFDLRYSIKQEKSRFDFGGNYRKTKVNVAAITTQQDLGTWGISNPRDVELYAPGVMEAFCLACRFDDLPVGQADVAFRGDATQLYSLLTPIYQARGNAVSTNSSADQVEENIKAIYGQFGLDAEFLGRPIQINGGLRYERTEVNSTSIQTVPTNIRWTADNDFSIDFGSQLQNVTGKGAYSHLLPNVDFKMDITDKLVGRMSYSETIGRVPYGNLTASTTAGAPNNPTALNGLTGGNSQDPNLVPLQSQNFDVSLEWYYGDDSYVSVGFFDKTVKNFLGNGVFNRPLFGLKDPSSGAAGTRSGNALAAIKTIGADQSPANLFTFVALIDKNNGDVAAAQAEFQSHLTGNSLPQAYVDSILGTYDILPDAADPLMEFRVTQPVNTDQGTIDGWEFAFQHFFGGSGFGLAGSYTLVNGSVDADPQQDPNENQFALVGLSDSANLTVMFEKFGLSSRLAYNWRDDFLSGTNQGGWRSPRFTEAYGQLDASVSYDINDHIQVQLDGINLLGADQHDYYRKTGITIWSYELSPRYSIGARYRF